MRLLVIGGTSFVGRHTVEHAVGCGHEVTVFHRGRTNADLLAGRVEHCLGDRATGDYASLTTGQAWDAVIDVSAYFPRAVRELGEIVGDRVGHCVHVSSISAYDESTITPGEDAPLCGDLDDPADERVTETSYGPLKAMCERAAAAAFGADRTAIVRPTYVVGPYDPTDRFTYWVRRMACGGDVAVVHPSSPLQVIDGRDLGAFIVHLAIGQIAGAFDGVGPAAPLSDVLAELTPPGVDARLVDVGGPALDASGVDLPMLSSERAPDAFMNRPGAGAVANGLRIRPLGETVAALRRWDAERGTPPLVAGPDAGAEARLLAASR